MSAGCANCYAETLDRRFTGGLHWGKGAPRLKSKSAVRDALRLNKLPLVCNFCGTANPPHQCMCSGCSVKIQHFTGAHRRRVFSLSLGDWLDPEVPVEWLAEMLDTVRQCDQLTWILCTKRPEKWYERMAQAANIAGPELNKWLSDWIHGTPPPNIILLASVENQEQADKRIPELLRIPAACRGLSLEPLLGPVRLERYLDAPAALIHWLIVGGESGPNARPCHVEWVQSLVRQGLDAGVAVFVKQLGENALADEASPDAWPPGTELVQHVGKPARVILRDKKGGDPDEWRLDLRLRQWPKGF